MDTLESTKPALQCDCSKCLKSQLQITKRVWQWSRSNSPDYKKVQLIWTHTLMLVVISQLQGCWQQRIGMMLTKAKAGQWCDYCASRFGKSQLLGQKAASWTIVSEHINKGMQRHYCNSCAIEVSTWADGSFFGLAEQLEYTTTKKSMTQGEFNGF